LLAGQLGGVREGLRLPRKECGSVAGEPLAQDKRKAKLDYASGEQQRVFAAPFLIWVVGHFAFLLRFVLLYRFCW